MTVSYFENSKSTCFNSEIQIPLGNTTYLIESTMVLEQVSKESNEDICGNGHRNHTLCIGA